MSSHEVSNHEIIGIDVAARKLVVIGERLALAEYENTAAGRSKLVNALSRSPQPVRVVLEATGMYFLDLACELAAAGIAVMVVNPKPAPGNEQGATHHFAEAILQRRKTDPVDAAMLREYGRRMDFVSWQPPRHELFGFRALTREVQALSKTVAAARNRLHAITATQLAPAVLIGALERQIAHNQALINELVATAVAQTASDPELARLLARTDSVPGFAAKPAPGREQGAAVLVIGELAVLPPMTARQWVAQAGLDVREETSGSSLARRPRLSKRGNKRLREALFYPPLTAARCCPAAAAPCSLPGAGFVERLVAHGKTRLQAIVVLMRKLLHGLHAMWRNDEDFDAEKLFAPA
jgi:transposase